MSDKEKSINEHLGDYVELYYPEIKKSIGFCNYLLSQRMKELDKAPIYDGHKPEDREDEKRFIIPFPGLVTTDNEQQYLTHADGTFFASRRDETLQQIWKEEHLELIPEQYRQFAMELVLK